MGKVLSLAEELSANYDGENETTDALEAVADVPEGKPAEVVAEVVVETPEAETTQADIPPATETTQETTVLETEKVSAPPATWSAGAKAEFAKLPDVVRKEIAKRETDFARGIQQHAEKAKLADKYLNEFQPYEHIFRAHNVPHEAFLRQALSTEMKLMQASPQQKAQILVDYAKAYGADLSVLPQILGLNQNQDAPENDFQGQLRSVVGEMVNPVLQKVQSWEQQQMAARQQQEAHLTEDATSQIEAFRNATNADGTPKNLYFENVRETMGGLIANGQAKTLEQAYDMACWASPEVRNALIAERQRQSESQRLAEAQRKTKDARNASFGVTGQDGAGINGTSQMSLRDELSATFDAAVGGGRI